MIEKVKAYVQQSKIHKDVLQSVFESPYSNSKHIFATLSSYDQVIVEEALEELKNELIVVELTSQTGSNIESRVPQKILLINPDIEEELEELIG